jgi:2-keto-4-pentenoate hydratase
LKFDLEALATQLIEATKRRSPLAIENYPQISEDVAYEVQRRVVRALCENASQRVAGFKISMTSRETQALARASGPAYGTLTSNMILREPAELALDQCFEGLLELELQFIVEDDLSGGATRSEIEEKCSIAPGIEVPDSRFRGWYGRLSVGHIVSDDAVAGHVVLGAAQPLRDIPRLPEVTGELFLDDVPIAGGVASAVMGDPVTALEWLTGRLAREGRVLLAGMVVSSGTLCMPVRMQPGRYRAHYERVGDVRLTVTA